MSPPDDGTARWGAHARDDLASLAPHAVLVLPIGATEQHGPHLATATDSLIVEAVARRACSLAAPATLLAPTVAVGASDHHLQFGGTLSLRVETLQAVLLDLLRSAASAGVRRALLLNGHGGNAPSCTIAAREATLRHELRTAAASYWDLIDVPELAVVPGHAGAFETSLVLALEPELVRLDRARPSPAPAPLPGRGVTLTDPANWRRIDGFTDDPREARAELGAELVDRAAHAVARLLAELAEPE